MTIERIFVAASKGEGQVSVEAARVVVGCGIEGDRNFRKPKTRANITFVAAEEIEHFNAESGLSIDLSGTRRNVVTRGVRLNDLVGRDFAIGAARFRGVELCEPCSLLAARLKTDTVSPARIVRLLTHRGGLRAQVLTTATIRVGDAIQLLAAPPPEAGR